LQLDKNAFALKLSVTSRALECNNFHFVRQRKPLRHKEIEGCKRTLLRSAMAEYASKT
jgi:hypothetical protein